MQLKGTSCIIADDAQTMRDRLNAVAVRYGMIVLGVYTNGKEALDGALKLKPTVCLLDIIMSEMTGIEVCHALKKVQPQTKVVLVTSSAQKDLVAQELTLADGLLVKPFPDEWFLHKLFAIVQLPKAESADYGQMVNDG